MTTQTAPNRPFFWLGLAFVGGSLLASWLNWRLSTWLVLGGSIMLVLVLLSRTSLILFNLPAPGKLLVTLGILSLLLGGMRYQVAQPVFSPFFVAWYNDREYKVTLTGWLAAPVDPRDGYTNLRIHLENIDTGDGSLPVTGMLLARLPPGSFFQVGDVLRLRGYLETPPENEEFSYREYLATQGIHSILPAADVTALSFRSGSPFFRAVFTFRDHLLQIVGQIFPEPEASLLSGILLGMDRGLSPGLQQAFTNTGTAHIIAISGFNIAILAALFSSVFGRLWGARRGALAAAIGIAFYTLLVGAQASVLRAALMGGSALFARQIGRRQDGLNTLGLAAGLMCLVNPFLPWDVGFQLSFAATLGLVLYAKPLQEFSLKWLSRRLPQTTTRLLAAPLAEFLLFTLAAQLTTLPLVAYHFGQISLVSFLANPFILPAQPPVMITSGLALLLGLIYLPLGQVAAWLAWPFSTYTIRMVELFNQLPHGVLYLGDFSFISVVVFYLVLFSLTFAPTRLKESFRSIRNPAFGLASLGLLTLLTWRSAASLPDGRLQLVFLDVDSADALLIQTPTGRNLLVNGGPSRSVLSDALGRRLPLFSRELDFLVLASPIEEQVTALAGTLDRFPPAGVVWSGPAETSRSALQLRTWLAEEAIPITQAEPGLVLALGNGANLTVLAVSPRGAILLVEWQSFRALLPIGLDFENLASLVNNPSLENISLYLLADSGFAPLNPPEWIDHLHPLVSILSVSSADPNGLPDPQTLIALQDYALLRTDRSGWIQVSTDGTRMWVETER
jgi:competence protein ComEC